MNRVFLQFSVTVDTGLETRLVTQNRRYQFSPYIYNGVYTRRILSRGGQIGGAVIRPFAGPAAIIPQFIVSTNVRSNLSPWSQARVSPHSTFSRSSGHKSSLPQYYRGLVKLIYFYPKHEY